MTETNLAAPVMSSLAAAASRINQHHRGHPPQEQQQEQPTPPVAATDVHPHPHDHQHQKHQQKQYQKHQQKQHTRETSTRSRTTQPMEPRDHKEKTSNHNTKPPQSTGSSLARALEKCNLGSNASTVTSTSTSTAKDSDDWNTKRTRRKDNNKDYLDSKKEHKRMIQQHHEDRTKNKKETSVGIITQAGIGNSRPREQDISKQVPPNAVGTKLPNRKLRQESIHSSSVEGRGARSDHRGGSKTDGNDNIDKTQNGKVIDVKASKRLIGHALGTTTRIHDDVKKDDPLQADSRSKYSATLKTKSRSTGSDSRISTKRGQSQRQQPQPHSKLPSQPHSKQHNKMKRGQETSSFRKEDGAISKEKTEQAKVELKPRLVHQSEVSGMIETHPMSNWADDDDSSDDDDYSEHTCGVLYL